MAKQSLSHLTLKAIDAALLAGDILKSGFGKPFDVKKKPGKHNLVTEYDHKAEKAIKSFLKEGSFLAEESGKSGRGDLVWIIDPLDGTVNFAHGIPFFSVSIAAELKGKLVSGVIYAPMTQELFVAEAGKGATLDGKKIAVSKTKTLGEAFLATGFPYDLADNPFHTIEHFIDVLKMGTPIRRLGSAAIDLAYTAMGRFDGFFEARLEPWDVAAGKLILEEAGGQISHWDGTKYDIRSKKTVLGTNKKIHKEMTTLLKRDV